MQLFTSTDRSHESDKRLSHKLNPLLTLGRTMMVGRDGLGSSNVLLSSSVSFINVYTTCDKLLLTVWGGRERGRQRGREGGKEGGREGGKERGREKWIEQMEGEM